MPIIIYIGAMMSAYFAIQDYGVDLLLYQEQEILKDKKSTNKIMIEKQTKLAYTIRMIAIMAVCISMLTVLINPLLPLYCASIIVIVCHFI